ncbi:uncharacterized protein UV8b_01678 [Ustilaginoidea virens]|uniref:Uncharacterized protein n=1 Tax=Ustilaginoidea virens TaxID=1159556 RepID=A0A8E5MFG6_USTVR|nr:uncharacterized protein UV8b_01678 [Ustilaginoidea virens]QUC17437.1 hypothetical protein UV8b_01678 [Ustilaginoidea virens]
MGNCVSSDGRDGRAAARQAQRFGWQKHSPSRVCSVGAAQRLTQDGRIVAACTEYSSVGDGPCTNPQDDTLTGWNIPRRANVQQHHCRQPCPPPPPPPRESRESRETAGWRSVSPLSSNAPGDLGTISDLSDDDDDRAGWRAR